MPLGKVSLPGKWVKTNYSEVCGQQWLVNSDSVSVAIAFTRYDKFEFYKKELTNFNYVKAYYEWDAKYLAKQLSMNETIVKSDTAKHYLVWRIWGEHDQLKMNSYFLFGYKNYSVSSFAISDCKWTEMEKVKFLEDLYLKEF